MAVRNNPNQMVLPKRQGIDPLPRSPKRIVNASIDKKLFDATAKELRLRGRTVSDGIDWGMRVFLREVNPEAAKELGIAID